MPDARKQFIKAAKAGDVEKLRILLNADANLIHARDTDGSTALHCATWKGHQAVVSFFLSAGADVNAQDKDGKTPLHHTTFHKAKAAAKVLQNNGASKYKNKRRRS